MDQQMFSSHPGLNSALIIRKKLCRNPFVSESRKLSCKSFSSHDDGFPVLDSITIPCAEIHALFSSVYLGLSSFNPCLYKGRNLKCVFRQDGMLIAFHLNCWKIRCQYERTSRHFSTPIEIGLDFEFSSDHILHASSLFMIYG